MQFKTKVSMLNIYRGYRIYPSFEVTTTHGCIYNQLENSFVRLCHLDRCNIKKNLLYIKVTQTIKYCGHWLTVSIQPHTRSSYVIIPELIEKILVLCTNKRSVLFFI